MATLYSLAIGFGGLGLLAYSLAAGSESLSLPAILAFAAISFVVQRSGDHLGGSPSHRLSGVIDLAAVLALGPASGGAVAAASGFGCLVLDALGHKQNTARDLLWVPVFDAGLKASTSLAAGYAFAALGGESLLPVAAASATWFTLDHLGWALLDYLEGGRDRLRRLLRASTIQALLADLLSLPLSSVLALAYALLPIDALALLAAGILAGALLVRRWADGRLHLALRVAELESLEAVGRAIVQAQFDVEALCQLLYEHISRIADTTFFHVGLFSGDDYVIEIWMQEGRREPDRTFHLAPGVGLVNWMRDSRQPLLVRDFEKEMDSLPARPAYVSDRPPRSAIFVPLLAGQTVIGTLSAQSFRPDAYGPSTLRILSATANQAAVAIQKAQLFERERRRVRQLDAIGQVARHVSATLDVDKLFQQTVRLVRDSFGYYHVGIFTTDPHRQTISFEASASAGPRNVALDVRWGEGLIGHVASEGQAILAGDVEHDERYRRVDALEETRSELAVPLFLEDDLVGVLDVQSDQAGAFTSDDRFILETIGSQVAIAIQKARLYQAEQQQAWLSTALLQVSDALSPLSDIDEVITTLVRLTPMLSGVDRCGVLLWDAESETYRPSQSYGLTVEQHRQFDILAIAPGQVPSLAKVRTDRSLKIEDIEQGGGAAPEAPAQAFEILEMVTLPLIAQGVLLGVMLVDYAGVSRPFEERIMAMLTGIANQAATVIRGARLLQAQQEEAYVSMALLQVADAASRSTDLEEALSSVVRITPMLVGVEACALFLWDHAAGAFAPRQQYGLARDAEEAFWQARFLRDESPAREMMTGKPHVSAADAPGLAEVAQALSGGRLLMLPISVRGDLVGIMGIEWNRALTEVPERRLGILAGIAGQVAIAVESDRLLQEAAEQERMKHELAVAKRIQLSFLPEYCPDIPGWELAAVWRSAREVAGDFYDFIPLRPTSEGQREPMGIVIADVADKGVPAALFMALSRTLLRTMAITGRSPSSALALTNNLILADTRSELFVTVFYAILRPDTGDLAYVNAGHQPALLVRATGNAIEELRTGDMAMGVLPDPGYHEKTAHLDPGDILILYTDGVVEASNAAEEQFGRRRLARVAQEYRTAEAGVLAAQIDAAVALFVGDAPRADDLTLVVLKRGADAGRPPASSVPEAGA